MTIDQVTSLLVSVTLIEMMITIGLGVTVNELASVARNWQLIAKAALANYICVPAITIGLLLLFRTQPMVAAGFLILAVCPGAPYGPPFTSIANGNVTVAVGLMVLLAGSSALIAPLLLALLLPLMAGDKALQVDTVKIVMTLLVTQLLPLCAGVAVRHWFSALAVRLIQPANLTSKMLNLLTCSLIIGTHYKLLLEIRPLGYLGMLLLLLASLGVGWVFGGPSVENRKALTLATSLRNVGVGLVIATGNFAGTPAVTAVLSYGIFEILASLLLALWWGKGSRSTSRQGAYAPQGQA